MTALLVPLVISHLAHEFFNLAKANFHCPRLVPMAVSFYSVGGDDRVGVAAQQEVVLAVLSCFLFHPDFTGN